MLSGVATILLVTLSAQVAVGLPLLLPYKHLHKPSIELLKKLTSGPGLYIGGTLGVTILLVFLTSLWESMNLHPSAADTNSETMMLTVQEARAHVLAVCCFANIALGCLLPRLAHEVAFHDKLRKSHDALKRQAAGLTAEYTRLSNEPAGKGGQAAPGEEVTLSKSQLEGLMEVKERAVTDLKKANEENRKLDVSMQGLKAQSKNLEKSYDELTSENMRLRKELSTFSEEPRISKKGQ